MEHTKHLWRAFLILLVLGVAGIFVRHFLIPESFGEQGFYRYTSLGEFKEKPVIHGAVGSCTSCHQEIADTKTAGKHASVSCEVCHAPESVHAAGGQKIADMPTNPSHTLCATCHQFLEARPKEFPQVDVTQHLIDLGVMAKGEAIPDGACIVCHQPHTL
ncbi:MAG: cytochrome C [Candidatus Hydrogenedentes bacterium]|nr:cytochrome C [Candidatus Hydrogenedentota bacterium]MBI3117214.1 cytochrome C [Candidatus Hydrogenedentota bacterium]